MSIDSDSYTEDGLLDLSKIYNISLDDDTIEKIPEKMLEVMIYAYNCKDKNDGLKKIIWPPKLKSIDIHGDMPPDLLRNINFPNKLHITLFDFCDNNIYIPEICTSLCIPVVVEEDVTCLPPKLEYLSFSRKLKTNLTKLPSTLKILDIRKLKVALTDLPVELEELRLFKYKSKDGTNYLEKSKVPFGCKVVIKEW